MVEDFIKRAFEIRNAAHLQHWKTKSYSEHKALGSFYEDLIDMVDKYVEAYMGGVQMIGEVDGEKPDMKQVIEEEMMWLAKYRSDIAQNVPALENILDDITGMYARTLYKLENLR